MSLPKVPSSFVDHKDRPGLIGAVGNITGSVDVNISAMFVSRQQARGKALMILDLDEKLPEEARQKSKPLKTSIPLNLSVSNQ